MGFYEIFNQGRNYDFAKGGGLNNFYDVISLTYFWRINFAGVVSDFLKSLTAL